MARSWLKLIDLEPYDKEPADACHSNFHSVVIFILRYMTGLGLHNWTIPPTPRRNSAWLEKFGLVTAGSGRRDAHLDIRIPKHLVTKPI